MPPKVIYLTMENLPELEFEFFLAERLRRTVAELRASLSPMEFLAWWVYYGREAQKREIAQAQGKR